jgi:hypothetical protein
MSILISMSVAANVLLALGLVRNVRAYRSDARFAEMRSVREREATQIANDGWRELSSAYCTFAGAVAVSLHAIRADIDRNYHHTHDGHVLDRIANRLGREVEARRGYVYEIHLDNYMVREVEAFGGEVSTRQTMSLGQMLDFGWKIHARASERADQLTEVVRQPCGDPDHAGWLGKVLAIYELMCHRDKDLATRRLSAVVDAWRYVPTERAARYVEDVR